jgi:hypothetical protein
MSADEEDFYLRTGNIPYRFLEGSLGHKRGSGLVAIQSQISPNSFLNRMRSNKVPMIATPARRVGSGRQARAAIVKKVMQEKGLSLPKASKYVKDNGLY